jgi:hypothetical protein
MRVPIASIDAMSGSSRKHLYAIILAAKASADVAEALTPLIRQIESGKIAFRRSRPRSDKPDQWERDRAFHGI